MAHPHSGITQQIDRLIVPVASLGASTGVIAASQIDAARENGFKIIKSTAWAWGLNLVSEEFLVVGVAGDTLSLAEIEAKLEADPQSSSQVDNEANSRPVFPLGVVGGGLGTGSGSRPQRLKSFSWTIPEGQALIWWCFNMDNDALAASSQEIEIFAEYQGVWLRD